MGEKWFRLSEQGAGFKRLILTKYIYQIFGEFPVRIIAFFVALGVFLKAKEQRETTIKFMKIIGKRFVLFSAFVRFWNYANSLVDKFLSCLGKLNPDRFELDTQSVYNGAFFITTHVGNVEILRSLFQSDKLANPPRVNVFLQANACKIFNDFLKTFAIKLNIDIFAVEEINLETSILISERLKNGEILFMAGDRVSAQNESRIYTASFLGKKAQFPIGTLKFALMLNVPIYFIVCVKEKNTYKVFTEPFVTKKQTKVAKLEALQYEYVKFLEKYTLLYPEQFYNFYNIFTDD